MRTKLMILAILMAFCLTANADNVTKTYDLTFNGIEVTNKFDIQLIKADEHSVTVEVDTEYAPYLSVTTEAGILKVRFKKLPIKMQIMKDSFKMVIRTPMLNFIDLSGACKLTCTDEFDLGMNNFRASVSGASTVNTLKIKTIDASVRLSGNSRVFIDGEFADFEAKVEGASRLTFNGRASDFDAEVAASSELNVTGVLQDVNIEVKGASKAELMGQGVDLDATVSGASRLKAEEFPVTNAKIEAKGASNVTVDASESLKADISGASACKYRDRAGIRLNPAISGGGSFKTL
ncbi:MAG: DUF2807 domain-containing protein [Bacteroidales bacterium]|nr:DUF2807 domain-containing protein [Bacteroidales bacterium]